MSEGTTWLDGIGVTFRADTSPMDRAFDAMERDSVVAAGRVARNLRDGAGKGLRGMGGVGMDAGRSLGVGVTRGVVRGVGGMSRIGMQAGKALATGFGVGAVGLSVVAVREMGKATDAASSYVEAVGKSDAVFKSSSKSVQRWAADLERLGIGATEALGSAGTIGNLVQAMGVDEKTSARYSKRLVEMAADLGAFNDVEVGEALEAIRSGLSGEMEPMKRFGVNLSVAAIEAKALSEGLVRAEVDMTKVNDQQLKVAEAQRALNKVSRDEAATTLDRRRAVQNLRNAEAALKKTVSGKVPDLDAATKAQAAYLLMLEQTSNAEGMFAREAKKSLSNQRKITQAQVENLRADIGRSLLPGRLDMQKQVNADLLPAIEDALKANRGRLRTASTGLADALVPAGVDAVEWVSTDGVEEVESFVRWMKSDGLPILREAGDLAGKGFEWGRTDGLDRLESLGATLRDDTWPAVKDLGAALRDDVWPVFEEWGDVLRPLSDEALPALNTALGGTRDLLGVVAPGIEGLLGAFNDLQPETKKLIAGLGAGAYLGKKGKDFLFGNDRAAGGGDGGLFGTARGSSPKRPLFVVDVGAVGAGGLGGAAGAAGKRKGTRGGADPNRDKGGAHRGRRPGMSAGKAGGIFSLLTLGGVEMAQDWGDEHFAHQASSFAVTSDWEDIRALMDETNIARYAERFEIDLDRLAKAMTTGGDKAYLSQVLQDIKEESTGMGDEFGKILGKLPGVSNEASEAALLLEEINNMQSNVTDYYKRQRDALANMPRGPVKPVPSSRPFDPKNPFAVPKGVDPSGGGLWDGLGERLNEALRPRSTARGTTPPLKPAATHNNPQRTYNYSPTTTTNMPVQVNVQASSVEDGIRQAQALARRNARY